MRAPQLERTSATRASMPCAARGFTLVEAVVILALLAILAFVATGRMGSSTAFTQQSAAESLAGALRHAQKRAVAARSPVWVRFDAGAGTVRFCADAAPACTQPLGEPGSGDPLVFVAPAGVTMGVAPAGLGAIAFDALGRVTGGSGATTEVALDSPEALARVRTWNETGLTETEWTNK